MTVFYRKYRPQKLSELIGQRPIVETLLNQLTLGKISHGYLFSGPRGIGKTSTARIMAKAVNCQRLASSKLASSSRQLNAKRYSLNAKFGEPCNKCDSCLAILDGSHLDLVEIDAASNRGIEEIRDLREKVKLAPVSGKFKVYIIDEAHMLTPDAFNAFLKTLEEPPAHAIFILCTTNPTKLPLTIISRLQRFNFSRADDAGLEKVIKKIVQSESIKLDEKAISTIAKVSDGSYRDAVSVLDQLSAFKREIKEEDILNLAAVSGWNQLYDFVESIAKKQIKSAVLTIEKISESGADMSLFAREIIFFLEKLLFIKIGVSVESFDLDKSQVEKLEGLANGFTSSELQNLIKLFLVAEGEIKVYPLGQIPLVLAVCKYCGEPEEVDKETKRQGDRETEYIEETKETKGIRETEVRKVQEVSEVAKASKVTNVTKVREVPKGSEVLKVTNVSKVAESKGHKSAKSLALIERHWQEFLNKVKPVNAHVVALLKSTRPSEFDGVNLTLEVFYRFHTEKLEEPKIMMTLSRVIEEVMGDKINFKFVLAERGAKKPIVVAASDVVDAGEYELENAVSEIFSKQ